MALEIGQTVGRYVVEGLVGRGGMASVYKVRHTALDSLHALKVLSVHSDRIQRRLRSEGQAQARIRHPNVVVVHDLFEVDGAPALLMEFVDGPDLARHLEHGPLAADDAIALFTGIVAGVKRAHDDGLVHRDLKPANVLLAPREGGGWIPKVADFGLVKALRGGPGHDTATGLGMGTPAYMAPEQSRSARDVDARADIFSLGCILYSMVCGHPPYRGTDLFQILSNIHAVRYTPPERLQAGVPPQLSQAVRGALEPDPDSRIPDCDTLLAVLRGEVEWHLAPPSPSEGALNQPTRPGPVTRPDPTHHGASAPTITKVSIPTIAEPPPAAPGPASTAPALSNAGIGAVITGLVAAALTVVAWTFGPLSDPTDPRTPPSHQTDPGPPPLPPAPTPADTTPTPADIPPAPADTPPTPADDPPAQRASPDAEPTAAPTSAGQGPPQAAPQTAAVGRLKIGADPWAHITLDGSPAGITWFDKDVPVGPHRVNLRTESGATWETTVTVTEAAPAHVCWNFELATPCN